MKCDPTSFVQALMTLLRVQRELRSTVAGTPVPLNFMKKSVGNIEPRTVLEKEKCICVCVRNRNVCVSVCVFTFEETRNQLWTLAHICSFSVY